MKQKAATQVSVTADCEMLLFVRLSSFTDLLRTTCGADLLTSSWALTFWICDACSFKIAEIIPNKPFPQRRLSSRLSGENTE